MNAATQDESTIFELKPAYRARLGLLVWGVLLLPVVGLGLFLLARAWYLVASTRYRLTTQRLFAETGLIAKNLEEVELFRVKDVTLRQGVLDRLLGVGDGDGAVDRRHGPGTGTGRDPRSAGRERGAPHRLPGGAPARRPADRRIHRLVAPSSCFGLVRRGACGPEFGIEIPAGAVAEARPRRWPGFFRVSENA
jgi:hypothetical protein